MRLDFFIARATGLSRREVKILISRGEVSVDDNLRPKANLQLQPGQMVRCRGELVSLSGHRYLMLHKPAGMVSSTADHDGASVLQLLPPELRRGLHIVGRLDADTTGLLLLSSDGQWSHRITSPKSACSKVYRVTTARPLTGQMIEQLGNGVLLHGEVRPTLLLIASAVVTALPLLAFAGAARRLRLATVGFLMYINPSMQFVIALLVFNEAITPIQVASFALIWLALVLYSWSTWRTLQAEGADTAGDGFRQQMLQRFLTQRPNAPREDLAYLMERLDQAPARARTAVEAAA